MKTLRISWLVLALLPACSSDEPGPQPDNKLRTQAGFCGEWAKAACNRDVVAACDSDAESCRENQAAYCGGLIPVGYKSTNATQCIDAVKRAYADAELTADELRVVQRLGGACAYLIDGGAEEDETCHVHEDCNTVDGYTCVIKGGAAEGSCQVPVTVGGGEACDDEEVVCDSGQYCNGENCISSKFPDDDDVPCTYNAECGLEGVCQIPVGDTEGICVERAENGDPCTIDDECSSGYCLLASQICVSRVVLTVESSVCDDL